jgi:multicomponent Na+:H+ antiporter subunit E
MGGALALMALAWGALTGDLSPLNLAAGGAIGLVTLRIGGVRGRLSLGFLRRLPRALAFGAFFLKELIVANLRVARLVLGPRRWLKPALLAVPLDVRRDAEIAMLANLITLTPGTLSVDVSADRSTLYVHCLHVDDPDRVRRAIKHGLERRVAELFA